jgi:hypothetical protein
LALMRWAIPVRISARFLVPACRPILVCPEALDVLLPEPTLLVRSMRCAPSTLFRDADLTAFPGSGDTFALEGRTCGPPLLPLLLRSPPQLSEQFVHPPIDVRIREFVTGGAQGDLVLRPLEQVQVVAVFVWPEACYLGPADDVVTVDLATRATDFTGACPRHASPRAVEAFNMAAYLDPHDKATTYEALRRSLESPNHVGPVVG